MNGIYAALAYGILVIIGGIQGYRSAGSKVSLISGIISGLLLLAAAYLQIQGIVWGLTLAITITGILVLIFGIRLAKTRKFIPAGLMMVIGIVELAVMLSQLSWT